MATPDVLLAMASGAALAVLGALLLGVRPRRSEQLFFGAFAALWGAQVMTANVVRLASDPAVIRGAFLVSFALIPPAFLFLAHFTALVASGRTRAWLRGAALALAVAAGTVLVLDPRLVLADAGLRGGAPFVVYGPAAIPVFVVPFFGMFYVALAVLYASYRDAPTALFRARLRGILLALALFTSFHATQKFLEFLAPGPFLASDPVSGLAIQGLFLAGGVLTAAIAAHAALRPVDGRMDRRLVAAFALPAGVAVLERALATGGIVVDSVGVWRFATVAALGFALVRYQLFDIDLRVRRTVQRSTFAAAFVAAFFVPEQLTQNAIGEQFGLLIGLAAAAALAVAGKLVHRVADRIARFLVPGQFDDPAYLAERKREVYRTALERVLRDGQVSPDEDELLRDMRKALGITEREHGAMQAEAVRAVPAPA